MLREFNVLEVQNITDEEVFDLRRTCFNTIVNEGYQSSFIYSKEFYESLCDGYQKKDIDLVYTWENSLEKDEAAFFADVANYSNRWPKENPLADYGEASFQSLYSINEELHEKFVNVCKVLLAIYSEDNMTFSRKELSSADDASWSYGVIKDYINKYDNYGTIRWIRLRNITDDATVSQWGVDYFNCSIAMNYLIHAVNWLDLFQVVQGVSELRPTCEFILLIKRFQRLYCPEIERYVQYEASTGAYMYETNVNGISDMVQKSVSERILDISNNSWLLNGDAPVMERGKYLPVPKNWQKDRGVNMMSNAGKASSHALDQLLRGAHQHFLGGTFHYTDQTIQQDICRDFRNLTNDGSSASDRILFLLVVALYHDPCTTKTVGSLCEKLYFSRPITAEYNGYVCPIVGLGGMGAPTVFSLQSHVHAMIPLILQNPLRWLNEVDKIDTNLPSSEAQYHLELEWCYNYGKSAMIRRKLEEENVQVYGDDLGCRFDRDHSSENSGEDCTLYRLGRTFALLGMKQNVEKSFDNEAFRESCGLWMYHDYFTNSNYDITPHMWSRKAMSFDTNDGRTRAVLTLIAEGKALYQKGYVQAARVMAKFINSKVHLPNYDDSFGSGVSLPMNYHYDNFTQKLHFEEMQKCIGVEYVEPCVSSTSNDSRADHKARGGYTPLNSDWKWTPSSYVENGYFRTLHNAERAKVRKAVLSVCHVNDDLSDKVFTTGGYACRGIGNTFILASSADGEYLVHRSEDKVFKLSPCGNHILELRYAVGIQARVHSNTSKKYTEYEKNTIYQWFYHNYLVSHGSLNAVYYREETLPYLDDVDKIVQSCKLPHDDSSFTDITSLGKIRGELFFHEYLAEYCFN